MDNQKLTHQTWNEVAEAYRDHFMHLDLYNHTYDLFLKHLPKSSCNLLEIGCGPGNITRYILDQLPSCRLDAIDYAQNMVDIARKSCPEANIMLLDARNIRQLNKAYEGIISGFCTPYLTPDELEAHIGDVAGMLAAKGIFYLSFIEGPHSMSGYETGSTGYTVYVNYYEESMIVALLVKHKLQLVSSIPVIMKREGRVDSHQKILIARKEHE